VTDITILCDAGCRREPPSNVMLEWQFSTARLSEQGP